MSGRRRVFCSGTVCAWVCMPEKRVISTGTGVTDSSKPPHRCWEPNPGPLNPRATYAFTHRASSMLPIVCFYLIYPLLSGAPHTPSRATVFFSESLSSHSCHICSIILSCPPPCDFSILPELPFGLWPIRVHLCVYTHAYICIYMHPYNLCTFIPVFVIIKFYCI